MFGGVLEPAPPRRVAPALRTAANNALPPHDAALPFSDPAVTAGGQTLQFGEEGFVLFGNDHLAFLLIVAVASLVEYKLRDKINAAVFGRAGPSLSGGGGGSRVLIPENHWLAVHGPNVGLALYWLKLLSRVDKNTYAFSIAPQHTLTSHHPYPYDKG
jgi:hypothetical protein